MDNAINDLDPETRILRTRIDDRNAHAIVTPIYQCSAFSSESPYFYSRKDNPNVKELEQVISGLEGNCHALAVTTGMTAISLAISQIRPGQEIVLGSDIYGCTYKLFQRVAERLECKLHILDLSTAEGIQDIPSGAAMVFFETPTIPFLKTISIKKVSSAAKSKSPQCLVVVDNTWATPLFQKPLEFGADICVYSATKYFSGHSDVMGGFLTTKSDFLAEKLSAERFYHGAVLAPHSAWLLRRSMQTFALRMHHHVAVTRALVPFLCEFSQIEKVYVPDIDGEQLTEYGGIIFCKLAASCKSKYRELATALKLFDTGTGMACVTSMIAQPFSGSHASMTEDEKLVMGLGPDIIRLCFGLESIEDLKNDLRNGFSQLGC